MGDAIGVDGWTDCFAGVEATLAIAKDGNSFDFDGEERGDFEKGELGPLGIVSNKVESKRSLVGLTARAFCLIPSGTDDGEEDGFVAFFAIEEAIGTVGGREGESLLLYHSEAKATAFGSSKGLFFEAPLPRVLTIFVGLKKHKEIANKRKKK